MGSIGISIVKTDIQELVNLLNQALADEWLAYYQYWVGAKVVRGAMKEAVQAELIQHATDELRHAGLLADRILQLGGTPILDPQEWSEKTNCGYDAPEMFNSVKILEQNIKGEQCAIGVYNTLLAKTKDSDPITYEIVLEILRDEVEHEDDLQALQEDMVEMKKLI